jgi:hypothetical protein
MRRFALLSLAALAGCAGLKPRLIDASVQKPSNIAVYFTVDTRDGEPVPGLTAEQFRIYEDDQNSESTRTTSSSRRTSRSRPF